MSDNENLVIQIKANDKINEVVFSDEISPYYGIDPNAGITITISYPDSHSRNIDLNDMTSDFQKFGYSRDGNPIDVTIYLNRSFEKITLPEILNINNVMIHLNDIDDEANSKLTIASSSSVNELIMDNIDEALNSLTFIGHFKKVNMNPFETDILIFDRIDNLVFFDFSQYKEEHIKHSSVDLTELYTPAGKFCSNNGWFYYLNNYTTRFSTNEFAINFKSMMKEMGSYEYANLGRQYEG